MNLKINGLSVTAEGDKNNQSIIFLHGFPFDSHMWHNQVERLKKNYYCVTYDLRGLGKSSVGDGQYTIEMYADELFSIMNELTLVKPVVCGLSMGGYIALRALEKNQNAFKAAVLCSTKSEEDDKAGKLKRAAGIAAINKDGVEKFCEGLLPNCFSDISMAEMKDMYEDTLARAKKSDPLGVKGCLLAMAGRTDTTAFLSQLDLPTLVIAGSIDKIVSAESMRGMAEKIKNSDFGSAPRAGHMTSLENPNFVSDMLEGFLRKLK
ncbi:MAG TPA: alpha/beta fold hydrolase [Ignavibacteriales bacterium]|nr:alpha/beta fold hydrolase [Ignavibacteriales bacterium]